MAFHLTYELVGHGWMVMKLANDSDADNDGATITASYLSDCLADLLRATASLVNGASEATVMFCEEPGEYRCNLHTEGARLNIAILWFKETFTRAPDEAGEQVYVTECRLASFAGAVLSATQKLLETHGIDGYRDVWGDHDFPLLPMQALRSAIRSRKTGRKA
jgi:hypothetical protein